MNQTIRFGIMINQKNVLDGINLEEIETIHLYIDEYKAATNGRYELGEGPEQEFKLGTYNLRYDRFFAHFQGALI